MLFYENVAQTVLCLFVYIVATAVCCDVYQYTDEHSAGECRNCDEAKFCKINILYNLRLCEQECKKYYADFIFPLLFANSTVPQTVDGLGIVTRTLPDPVIPIPTDNVNDFESADNSLPDWHIIVPVLVVAFLVIGLLALTAIFYKKLIRLCLKCQKTLRGPRDEENPDYYAVQELRLPIPSENTNPTEERITGREHQESGYCTKMSTMHSSEISVVEQVPSAVVASSDLGRALEQLVDARAVQQPAENSTVSEEEETLLKSSDICF